ncbi:glycogen/starch/alpha-glucan phosphorylase [Sesbania bispinosa]|nr:glycogen/starch/alpha-glucan phosphorylase [Sesbania bispinosa]
MHQSFTARTTFDGGERRFGDDGETREREFECKGVRLQAVSAREFGGFNELNDDRSGRDLRRFTQTFLITGQGWDRRYF